MKIGVGFRRELAAWLDSRPDGVSCLEITAEHFYGRATSQLRELAARYELYVHGLGLSLGTPAPLDPARLENFAAVVEAAQPAWVSEHVAFTRTAEADLGHLNPVLPTRESACVIAAHAREISERCGRPIILENITSHLRLTGELSETDFLNAVCAEADCGLLLDVTNLFINARNHRFDPLAWLHKLPPERIVQLHIVGYSVEDGRYSDGHEEPVQPELLELARAVISYAPVRALILERDAKFPGTEAMAAEIAKLQALDARG